MSNKRTRSYKDNTIKSLYAHSGNQCEYEGCNHQLLPSENINLSEICHIFGLNEGSARYDPSIDTAFLNSEANLILLCPTHHAMVDIYHRQHDRFRCFSMMPVLNESNADILQLSDVLRYLEGEGYIHECEYDGSDIYNWMPNDNGDLVNMEGDYPFKIQHGSWEIAGKGRIIEGIYATHGSL